MGQVTECVVCGKEIEWNQELFAKGEHGSQFAPNARRKNGA